jgi:hypothetical protein
LRPRWTRRRCTLRFGRVFFLCPCLPAFKKKKHSGSRMSQIEKKLMEPRISRRSVAATNQEEEDNKRKRNVISHGCTRIHTDLEEEKEDFRTTNYTNCTNHTNKSPECHSREACSRLRSWSGNRFQVKELCKHIQENHDRDSLLSKKTISPQRDRGRHSRNQSKRRILDHELHELYESHE